jgi:hypothetical protein
MFRWKRPSQLRPAPGTPVDADLAPERCLNCGTLVTARYCSHCGQEHSHKVVSIWRLLGDFVEDVFSWDSRLLRTTGCLLFRPGLLTEEYNKGRRVRYLSPFRLYLYTSAIMFFLAAQHTDSLPVNLHAGPKDRHSSALVGDSITINGGGINPRKTPEQYDTEQLRLPPDKRDSWFAHNMVRKTLALRTMRTDEFEHRLITGTVQGAPKGMFLLLPLFALLLKIIYSRRSRLYIEHLVFALHCHAFVFALLAVDLAWSAVRHGGRNSEAPVGLVLAAACVYQLAAMKRVYRQGWPKTVVKFGILGMAYSVLFLITMVGVILVSFLTA